MAPLHPREGSSLQDFINAVDLEQRGPDGWREVTLPREQYEAMLYQILVVDGGTHRYAPVKKLRSDSRGFGASDLSS